MFKYKIEEWDCEFHRQTFFVAFVRSWRGWRELGRADTKHEAEQLCRKYEAPARKPWLYTADSIRNDYGETSGTDD